MPSKRTGGHRLYSSKITETPERAASRAMLRAVGFSDADFRKSQVGVASTWSMVTPCNMHIDGLAREAEAGVNAAGGKVLSSASVRQRKGALICFSTAARTFFQIPWYGSVKVPASGCACAGMTEKECYVGHILEERFC